MKGPVESSSLLLLTAGWPCWLLPEGRMHTKNFVKETENFVQITSPPKRYLRVAAAGGGYAIKKLARRSFPDPRSLDAVDSEGELRDRKK